LIQIAKFDNNLSNKYNTEFSKLIISEANSNLTSPIHYRKNMDENIQKELYRVDLYKVTNYKKRLANKDTSNLISPYSSPKFKKENFLGNFSKINNMNNPFSHLEYFPNMKDYNLRKDHFTKHIEDTIRFKHLLVRGEIKDREGKKSK
jgi:hypothetical protein